MPSTYYIYSQKESHFFILHTQELVIVTIVGGFFEGFIQLFDRRVEAYLGANAFFSTFQFQHFLAKDSGEPVDYRTEGW